MANPNEVIIENGAVNNDAPPSCSSIFGKINEAKENSDAPPSYSSIFGKTNEAKEKSDGNVDFAKRTVEIACCGTVCIIVSLVLLFSLSVASVAIGAVYLDDCPMERYIPIYLVVSGVFGIVQGIVHIISFIVKKAKGEEKDDDDVNKKTKPNPVDEILNCFLFAWMIAGSVWVYSNYEDWQYKDEDENNYCHEVCYRYAFWTLTVGYIFVALELLCRIVGAIVACCCACCKKGE